MCYVLSAIGSFLSDFTNISILLVYFVYLEGFLYCVLL